MFDNTDAPTDVLRLPPSTPVPAAASAAGPPTLRLRGPVPVVAPVDRRRLPEVGDRFLDFTLLRLLGKGAFGRVFLAHQGELADRPVALKVTPRVGEEFRTLARLQHANIVPIHSVHHTPDHQAVCMPYFGGTTLAGYVARLSARPTLPDSGLEFATTLRQSAVVADVAPGTAAPSAAAVAPTALDELTRRTYVGAVLWVGAQLAEGLAHAHDRGVLHCDVKPANILVTDEGRPMLLDFNVSRTPADGPPVAGDVIGGTVPYVSPEQLREHLGDPAAAIDARSDVYALGLVLYELLAGSPAYPAQRDARVALAARATPARPLFEKNRHVTRAADAVVRRCLHADPDRRYPTARALAEDLNRHLADLPLKHTPEPSPVERMAKWTRRNRWARSPMTGLAAAAAVVLLATSAWAYRAERAKLAEIGRDQAAAAATFADSRGLFRRATLALTALPDEATRRAQAVADGRAALDVYAVLDGPGWRDRPDVQSLSADDRAKLNRDVGLLTFLLRQAVTADGAGGELGDRLRALGDPAGVAESPLSAASVGILAGKYRQTIAALRDRLRTDPEDLGVWYTLGTCHARVGAWHEAAAAFSTCVALQPGFSGAYLQRGVALLRHPTEGRDYRQARADFDRVVALEPGLADGYVYRAAAAKGLWDYAAAVADLTTALALPNPSVKLYFLRADAYRLLGDAPAAAADRAEGLRRTPADEDGWVSRGLARMAADPALALGDFERAEGLNPRSLPALQNQAYVLGERLGRDADAVAKLDRLLGWYPEFAFARAGRAVHLARLGRVAAAVADADECLKSSPSPETWYRAACTYALCSKHDPKYRDPAVKLAAKALKAGFGANDLATDDDLAPLHGNVQFAQLAEAARILADVNR